MMELLGSTGLLLAYDDGGVLDRYLIKVVVCYVGKSWKRWIMDMNVET